MPNTHLRFRYSVECHTDDLAVLYCLRALSRWAERGPKLGRGGREIGYGGTKDKEWEASNHRATFRFTNPTFRQQFIDKALELLPDKWRQGDSSDDNPAVKQR